jgi:hypothetical protein
MADNLLAGDAITIAARQGTARPEFLYQSTQGEDRNSKYTARVPRF